MSRIAREVLSHTAPPGRRLAIGGRVGLSEFAAAVDARLRYHVRHGRAWRHPLYQDNPRLGQVGKHIDDHYRRKQFIIKYFDKNKRRLRNLMPHLVGGHNPKQRPTVITPREFERSKDPMFRELGSQRREVFFNWRKGDQVRLVSGGILRTDDPRITHLDQDGNKSYKLYTIKSANVLNNTCTLEGLTRSVPNRIPLDRNQTHIPLGGLQDSNFRKNDIVFPLANVQLLIPRQQILDSMKRENIKLTGEQEDMIPQQVFAVKMETRNVVAPDARARIRPHEKSRMGLDPLAWRPDELMLGGKHKVFTWERWVTETEPAMHPSVRVDIEIPIEKPQARRRPEEFAPPGYEQESSPLATPSAVVLKRTWFPSYLHALGPSLDWTSNAIPDAYTDSMVSAQSYIASSHAPASLAPEPPKVLSPATLPKDTEVDAVYTKQEQEDRRVRHAEQVKKSKQAREAWYAADSEWRASVAADSLDPTLPMEYYANQELANRFSRPAMDKRFAARHEFERLEKAMFVEEAIKEHRKREGRIKQGLEPRVGRVMHSKEVKLTAERRYAEMWVDRKHDREVAKAERHREKWGPSKTELKTAKRAAKKAGLADRLRAVTLEPARNQVIPAGLEKLILPNSNP